VIRQLVVVVAAAAAAAAVPSSQPLLSRTAPKHTENQNDDEARVATEAAAKSKMKMDVFTMELSDFDSFLNQMRQALEQPRFDHERSISKTQITRWENETAVSLLEHPSAGHNSTTANGQLDVLNHANQEDTSMCSFGLTSPMMHAFEPSRQIYRVLILKALVIVTITCIIAPVTIYSDY
jgi:TolA-binding protein